MVQRFDLRLLLPGERALPTAPWIAFAVHDEDFRRVAGEFAHLLHARVRADAIGLELQLLQLFTDSKDAADGVTSPMCRGTLERLNAQA